MTQLTIDITINHVPVTQDQLALVQLWRTQHVLHEMKALGAPEVKRKTL